MTAAGARAVIPNVHEDFYRELVERNRGLIPSSSQEKLRGTRFVVAGCGSTGGACVMPLLRSGAERFVLLDPGAYELNNLNRQDATLAEIGLNKAAATARRILAVNPFADVEVREEGVDSGIAAVLGAGDIVVDAVDVTTDTGIAAKISLHEAACSMQLPVVTAYDIAGTQFIELFDYRRINAPFRGRIGGKARSEVLRALIPPWVVPREIFSVLVERRRDPGRAFPQLAMTSTLFGAILVAYVIGIVEGRSVRRRVRVDLPSVVRPMPQRIGYAFAKAIELPGLLRKLRG